LADIFGRLNDLNLKQQGHHDIFHLYSKVKEFKAKLQLYSRQIESHDYSSFPSLEDFLTENDLVVSNITNDIREHLKQLALSFDHYFRNTNDVEKQQWIRNPFIIDDEYPSFFSSDEKFELIELQNDTDLRDLFKTEELYDFWLRRRSTHPALSNRAMKFIMPFSTTYLCECVFSAMLYIKNKYRTLMVDLESNMRCYLSPNEPDFGRLVSDIQSQVSH
jgi:zinc finger BED domain-containing protein 5/7/8/9